ncbi:MAG: DUF1343 domain-containing protein [Myxococcota bacterium]|nr:DUF1343 domain-containing protein [Myxococcota bacterium]
MQTGLTRLLHQPKTWLKNYRVGLIANPTTLTPNLMHAADLLAQHSEVELRKLFGPEHGIRGDEQDMLGVGDEVDQHTGLPVISLYGKTFDSLKPQPEHLNDIDILIFDIQDIGTRYYTYAATMALAMQACAQAGIKFLVLDRPNPIGGMQIEGGGIAQGMENFCGLYSIPQRHAMSVGELAKLYNTYFGIGCELEVITCEGWQRENYFDAHTLPWVMPSPNMPTLETAIVYPGLGLFEGTNISEGRGTTRPFELFGAPFINAPKLKRELENLKLPGVFFRTCTIMPTFHKYQNEICGALQVHILDRQTFHAYNTGLALLATLRKLYPEDFKWRTEMYEFRDDVPAIDLLTGSPDIRIAIDAGKSLEEIWQISQHSLQKYESARPDVLIYE